ncbi:tyrosine-type recombinase/integrase [Aquimarina hainanensis]|uniref:Tyrosine-type recombinase/integrase n=1 Tax=Aquimarina hainanensis TaxID=1578017 RepID=A0ABW5N6U5_9FLAO
MKVKYTGPFIYCGGGKLDDWDEKTEEEKKEALNKDWLVYWRFRHPVTGILTRQDDIKIGNGYKTKEEREKILLAVKKELEDALKKGHNPYEQEEKEKESAIIDENTVVSVKEAFDISLGVIKTNVSKEYYKDIERCSKRLISFLERNKLSTKNIKDVSKVHIVRHLSDVALKVSAKSRNDEKTFLSSLFNQLELELLIDTNFVKEIPKLKHRKKRSLTYSDKQELQIQNHLKNTDEQLLLFVYFVSYTFFREIETCRIKIKDINLEDNLIVCEKIKQKDVKTKRIPSIVKPLLVEYLNNNKGYSPDDYLFTKKGIGKWERDDTGRRDYFTRKYNRLVKKPLKISAGYHMTSHRHTVITRLFKTYLSKGLNKHAAIDKLSLITGHSSNAVWHYIHNLDAELPDDWSDDAAAKNQ